MNAIKTNAKLECLETALDVIANCQETGKVAVEDITPISSAIALGISPPAVLPGRKPLQVKGVNADPGTWPQFATVLVKAVEEDWDGPAMRAKADAARKHGQVAEAESAETKINFFKFVLSAVRQAIYRGIKAEEAESKRQEAEAKREAEKAKREAEARLSAEQRARLEAERAARKAKLDALRAAAEYNKDAAPVVLKPKPERPSRNGKDGQREHPPLTVERVKTLLDGAIKRNERGNADKGFEPLDASEARREAARWVAGIVVRDRTKYSAAETDAFMTEIKAVLVSGFMLQGTGLVEAERDANQKLAALLYRSQPKPERPRRNGNGQQRRPQFQPPPRREAPKDTATAPAMPKPDLTPTPAPEGGRSPEEIAAYHEKVATAAEAREANRAANVAAATAKAEAAKRQANREAEVRAEARKAAAEQAREEREGQSRKGKPKRDHRTEAQAEAA